MLGTFRVFACMCKRLRIGVTGMGFYMRDALVRYEECQAALLSEVEFAETAHVLKMLAADVGMDHNPVILALVRKGLDEALDVIATSLEKGVRIGVRDAFLQHRSAWRAQQSVADRA